MRAAVIHGKRQNCNVRRAVIEAVEDRRLFDGLGSDASTQTPTISVQAEAPVIASAAAASRPNFVFVIADDFRYDALGFRQRALGDAARFPWLDTPNLDKLRSESTFVRNAFVTTSVCSPARATFLTGAYSHKNGIKGNFTPFPVGSVTYATQLQQAGYDTAYLGKWHMGLQSGQRPGFDYSVSPVGAPTTFNCTLEINGRATATTGFVDDVLTNYAIDYLGTHANTARPFALTLALKSPHSPYNTPYRFAGKLTTVKASPPVNANAYPPYVSSGTQPSDFEMQSYFRCVLAVDEAVGKVATALSNLNLTQNTVVIFTSDNGFLRGEHGQSDKRLAYEESIRIPMMIRYPALMGGGGTLDQMVLSVDVAPTMLDLAGVAIPAAMDGRSIKPLLTGSSESWRTDFLYQYFEDDGYPPPFAPPELHAVRSETAKLVKWVGKPQWTQLFDLQSDPYETRNLYNKPEAAALQTEMLARYDAAAARVGYVQASAGNGFKLNFQPSTSPAVPGYSVDSGRVFGNQNGRAYGWNKSHTDSAFDRNGNINQLLDTCLAVKSGSTWEMAVANGKYTVKVGIGDAAQASTHTVYVEGQPLFVNQSLRGSQYNILPATVNVTDGRITLSFGNSPNLKTRLVYLTVTGAGTVPPPPPTMFKANFQPASAPGVSGYLIDAGLTYAARNGRTYGWTVSHADSVVDRNVNSNQLLDTNVGVKAAAKWELAVPNGTYTVKVGIGDAGASSRNNVWIEGMQLFNYVTLAANAFSSKLITVNVTDGKLTMGIGGAATGQTRINFLEVA